MSRPLRITAALETMPLGDLAQIVSNGKKTGTLELRRDGECLRFVFRSGALVAALTSTTETPDQQLAALLVRDGILSEVEIEAVNLAADRRQRPFGQTLLALRLVEAERLEEALETWIENLFAEALDWRHGSLQFRASREDEIPSLPALISIDKLLIKVFE